MRLKEKENERKRKGARWCVRAAGGVYLCVLCVSFLSGVLVTRRATARNCFHALPTPATETMDELRKRDMLLDRHMAYLDQQEQKAKDVIAKAFSDDKGQ